MSLYAFNKNNDRIFAPECKLREEFHCQECDGIMRFVNAMFKIKHFRHKVECPYETEPETQEHLRMKLYFKELYNNAELEVRVGKNLRRADVLVGDVVIECQHSPISVKEMVERTKDHNKYSKYVLWIFSSAFKNKKRRSSSEKFMYYLYGQNIYFANCILIWRKNRDSIIISDIPEFEKTIRNVNFNTKYEPIQERLFVARFKSETLKHDLNNWRKTNE